MTAFNEKSYLVGIAVAALHIARMGKPGIAADMVKMEDKTYYDFIHVGLGGDEKAYLQEIIETPYD